jgi:hypothetical protein
MSVLGRMRKAVATALFHKNSVKRVTILLRGLAAGLVASVPLVLSTELFAGGEWPDGPNKHWASAANSGSAVPATSWSFREVQPRLNTHA